MTGFFYALKSHNLTIYLRYMKSKISKYIVKKIIVLGVLYSLFFIALFEFVDIDISFTKLITTAIVFAVLSAYGNANIQLKQYVKFVRSEISLRELVPDEEDTCKEIGDVSLEKLRVCMEKTDFIEDRCSANYLRYKTLYSWWQTIPSYILIIEKDGMLNIRIYQFLGRNFYEKNKSEAILKKVIAVINSCS